MTERLEASQGEPGPNWDTAAQELFTDLLSNGPPEAFRVAASAAVQRAAEHHAMARGSVRVATEDVVNACLQVAPPAFRPRVLRNLARRGLQVPFTPSDTGSPDQVPPTSSAPVFDSEWDRVHSRIAPHRDEVERIYSLVGRRDVLTVLDMACGTGKHLLEFARDGHRCHGVDQQSWKLEIASQQARERKLEIRVTTADFLMLACGESYDLVVCLYAMSTIANDADLEATMRVAARHLTPTGTFVFNVINRDVNSAPDHPMYRSVHEDRHLRDYAVADLGPLLSRAELRICGLEYAPLLGVEGLDLMVAAKHRESP